MKTTRPLPGGGTIRSSAAGNIGESRNGPHPARTAHTHTSSAMTTTAVAFAFRFMHAPPAHALLAQIRDAEPRPTAILVDRARSVVIAAPGCSDYDGTC